MPELQTPTAEPSPATEATPAATPQKVEVPKDPNAYAEWRKSGKLPDAKAAKLTEPKSEEAAASNEDPDNAPSAETGETKQEHKPKAKSNAETRLNELLADLKRAGFTPAELKSYKRQQEQPAPKPEAQAPQPAKPEAPKRPKLEDFDSYEKYEEARETYFEQLADFRAEKKFSEHEAKRLEAEQQRATHEKLDAATGRYGEEAARTITDTAAAIANDGQISDQVKAIVDGSPVIADLLYVMGSKPEDLAEFVRLAKTDPGAAIRKAVLVENLIREELSKSAAGETPRAGDGKFASDKPPAKKTTQAPPPPTEASGTNAAPPDALARAIAAKDFATFRKLANERDLAHRKGR